MSKNIKITLISFIVIAGLLLLAIEISSRTNKSNEGPRLNQQTTPANTDTAPQQTQGSPADLAPLPTNTKQAIDSELQGIDQSLQTTDSALSADVPDGELGL